MSGARGKRSVTALPSGEAVDVVSGFEILDIQDKPTAILPEDLAHRGVARHLFAPVIVTDHSSVCVSPVTVGVSMAALFALAAALVTIVVLKKQK